MPSIVRASEKPLTRRVRVAVAAIAAVFLVLGAPHPTRAESMIDVLPPEWLELYSAPVEWTEVTDVATGLPPETISEVAVLVPGQVIELRVKLASHTMPSSFAQFHATLARVSDAQGNAGRGPVYDLGVPSMDNGESWVRFESSNDLAGGYLLAITADPADGQPGYMIGIVPFVALPPAGDPTQIVDAAAPTVVTPPAPPAAPAPPPAPPAQPPQAPAPQPPAQQPAPAPAPPEPAPVTVTEQVAPAPVAVEQPVAAPPVEQPAWMFPTLLGIGGAAVVAAVIWRVTMAAQKRASIRRLSQRPD